ncbi:MAG: hypothetical protein ACQEWU_20465 [Bacillota bacterium]
MKNAYLVAVHVVNLIFLGVVGFLGIGMFINISEPDNIPTFNPINIGLLISLLSLLVVNYTYQIKNRKWIVLLFANLLYIAISVGVVMVTPFLFRIFYL